MPSAELEQLRGRLDEFEGIETTVVDQFILVTSVEDFIGDNVVFANSFEDFNTDRNVDIKISQNMFDTKRIEYKLEKSKQLPKVSGFISGTYTGYNNEFDFTNKSQNWFGSSVVGVNLEIPLFNANRMNVSSQKAKIAMEKARTSLEEQQDRTQAKVLQKLSEYQLALKSLDVNEQTMNAEGALGKAELLRRGNGCPVADPTA